MKLKVLPLDGWMKFTSHSKMESQRYFVLPEKKAFGKNAVYFDRETQECWFEKDGISYTSNLGMSKDYFMFRISSINAESITSREYEAVVLLMKTLSKNDTLLKKELNKKIYLYGHIQHLRKLRKTMSIGTKRIRQRINDMKANMN